MVAEVSYASGTSNTPLLGSTIGDKFDETVALFGDRQAVVSVHQNERLSYSELADRVDVMARAIMAAGLNKGDRIGIWSPNNIEWLVTQYASAKTATILVTINPAYRVHELSYVLKQSGCKALVLQNQFKTSDYESMIGELCPELEDCNAGELQSSEFEHLTTIVSMTSSEVKGIFD